MTNVLLSQLDTLRIQHGCGSDQYGSTQKHATKWSKRILDGHLKPAGGVIIPPAVSTFPRHEPALDLLKKKYPGFGWSTGKHERNKRRTVDVIVFHNYPGAEKGYTLTLADLLILPAEEVGKYAEALCQAQKRKHFKTKRRRGAGRFDGASNSARCNAWS